MSTTVNPGPQSPLSDIGKLQDSTIPTDRVLAVAVARWPGKPLHESIPLALQELLMVSSPMHVIVDAETTTPKPGEVIFDLDTGKPEEKPSSLPPRRELVASLQGEVIVFSVRLSRRFKP